MRRVHVIGASNFDIRVQCKSKICANSSLPSIMGYSAGGVGRNIAHNLAIMQVSTTLTSIVSNDIFGESILAMTNIDNLDISHIIRFDGDTSFYCDIYDGFDNYKFNDMHIIDELDICHLPANLSEATLVVIDLNLSKKLLTHIAHKSRVPIICDATSTHKCAKIIPFLSYISALKCNFDEAKELATIIRKNNCSDDVIDIAEAILSTGVETIYITLGRKGALFADKNDKYELRINNSRLVSAVGAGDAFTSAIVYGMYNNFNFIDILEYAVKISSSIALCETNVIDRVILDKIKHLGNENYSLQKL